jgi:hypothetical protein
MRDKKQCEALAINYSIDKNLIFKVDENFIFFLDTDKKISNVNATRKRIDDRYVLNDSNTMPLKINLYYALTSSNVGFQNDDKIRKIKCEFCKHLVYDYRNAIINKMFISNKNQIPIYISEIGCIFLSKELLVILGDNNIALSNEKLNSVLKNDKYMSYEPPVYQRCIINKLDDKDKKFMCDICGLEQICIHPKKKIIYKNLDRSLDIFSSKETHGAVMVDETRYNMPYYIFSAKVSYIIEYLYSFVPLTFQANFYWQIVEEEK